MAFIYHQMSLITQVPSLFKKKNVRNPRIWRAYKNACTGVLAALAASNRCEHGCSCDPEVVRFHRQSKFFRSYKFHDSNSKTESPHRKQTTKTQTWIIPQHLRRKVTPWLCASLYSELALPDPPYMSVGSVLLIGRLCDCVWAALTPGTCTPPQCFPLALFSSVSLPPVVRPPRPSPWYRNTRVPSSRSWAYSRPRVAVRGRMVPHIDIVMGTASVKVVFYEWRPI